MRAKDFLTELTDKPYSYGADSSNHEFDGEEGLDARYANYYYFTTDDGAPYSVTIERRKDVTSIKYRGPTGISRPLGNTVKHKFKILSTILSILRKYFENPYARTKFFEFSGTKSDPKRIEFYDKIARNKIEEYIPWYAFDSRIDLADGTVYQFRLKG